MQTIGEIFRDAVLYTEMMDTADDDSLRTEAGTLSDQCIEAIASMCDSSVDVICELIDQTLSNGYHKLHNLY